MCVYAFAYIFIYVHAYTYIHMYSGKAVLFTIENIFGSGGFPIAHHPFPSAILH